MNRTPLSPICKKRDVLYFMYADAMSCICLITNISDVGDDVGDTRLSHKHQWSLLPGKQWSRSSYWSTEKSLPRDSNLVKKENPSCGIVNGKSQEDDTHTTGTIQNDFRKFWEYDKNMPEAKHDYFRLYFWILKIWKYNQICIGEN